MNNLLVADKISKRYGNSLILNEVSLSLNRGEISVILGPSGGGKTTLLRCLCMLDIPNSGLISIDKRDFFFPCLNVNYTNIYPNISIVFQQLFLWHHLTNRENIAFPLRQNGFKPLEIEAIIQELIIDLNLTNFIEKFPHQSSVGQKQRIAIARTLALKPECILLDEITSALDVVQTNNIIQILKSLAYKQNIAILFVTHNLDVAKKVADKVLFLENGTIVEQGALDILENPKSVELCKFLGK